MVAEGLAREAHLPEEITAFEDLALCPRHPLGLALEVLDAAGGAPGVGATAVENVHAGVLFYRQDQPLPLLHVERANPLDL